MGYKYLTPNPYIKMKKEIKTKEEILNRKHMTPKKKKIFILTDGCMWEKNKQDGTSTYHAAEVVDVETGQVRYIRSGSRIEFVDGAISGGRTQDSYNQ